MDNNIVPAEVMYSTESGNVHSDMHFTKLTPEYREFLHANLDEMLDEMMDRPDGALFYVGNIYLA